MPSSLHRAICFSFFCGSLSLRAEAASPDTGDYLDLLASRITADQSPMASAESWNAGKTARRNRLMRMLGLDPLPEKTPLNPQYVGGALELEACTFRRVVFESAPGLFVAVHLYLPKGVKFPAPAVLYAPGHSRRDKYLPHPLAYASKGFVAIGLPMVGEEGRIDKDAGKCGHYGPFHDHFDWLSSGYTPAGAEVWDTIRAVDFLLTLEDANGKPFVDAARIGMAGLSGGSARTFWATAADPRISAAVACQGFTTVSNYDSTIRSTCDVHLFYNYYHQSYAEIYGNAAPRALRVIQATEDPLYRNPQPVADALTKIYDLLGMAGRFSYVTFPGGHGYTPEVIASEQEWLSEWLNPETPALPEIGEAERGVFEANRALLNDPKNLQCFTGSRDGWRLQGRSVRARSLRTHFTPKTPVPNIADMEAFLAMKHVVLRSLKDEVLMHAYSPISTELKLDEAREQDDLSGRGGTLILDGTLRHSCHFTAAPKKSGKTVVLLAEGGVKGCLAQARSLAMGGANVLVVEVTSLKDRHLRRYAALVGHTSTSLMINDALAAVRALRNAPSLPSDSIFVHGKGNTAVAALYAAIVDPMIAGVMLEDCPDRFNADTALLGILRHSDLPLSAALLFPRSLELLGHAAPGFDWTAKIYETLGRKEAFKGSR